HGSHHTEHASCPPGEIWFRIDHALVSTIECRLGFSGEPSYLKTRPLAQFASRFMATRSHNPDSPHHSFDKPLTTISDILIRFIRTSKKMYVPRGPALREVEWGHRPQPR